MHYITHAPNNNEYLILNRITKTDQPMSRLRTILSQKASDKSLEQLNGYFKDIYERREDPKELLAQFPTMLEHLFIQSHGKRYVARMRV